jgi:hypothetical protein
MSRIFESDTVAAIALAIVLAGLGWLAWTGLGPALDILDSSDQAGWLWLIWLVAAIIVVQWIKAEQR